MKNQSISREESNGVLGGSARKYNFFSDPGHGWMEVPITELRQLGILNTISGYSYRKNVNGEAMAYLEEDCDMGRFIAAKGRENVKLNEINSDEESPIRNYNRF